jgi:predicted hotdog family 3-hydroxylacyl-ACP dehydratase
MCNTVESLIPHRAPLRFIDTLTACSESAATAEARFGADHFAVTDGVVLDSALVECAAQTVAAAMGQRAKARGLGGVAANGMLVAVTNFKIQAPALAEKTISIEIRDLKRLGLMLMISAILSCEGRGIATGELTVYA